MKKILCFIVAIFSVAFAGYSQNQINQSNKTAPLTLTIKSDKQLYKEGEPIVIALVLKNISDEKISVFIRYLKMGPYPLTKDGGSCILMNSKNERIEVGKVPVQDKALAKSDYIISNPNESHEFQFILNDFVLKGLKPDVYTIKYSNTGHDYYYDEPPTLMKKVEYPWLGTVVSNQISISVVSKEDLTALQKAWQYFLNALKSGDQSKIKTFTTDKGYQLLVQHFKVYIDTLGDDFGEQFKQLGSRWSNYPAVRWWWITQTYANGSIGPNIKESGIDFLKVNGEWKFDHFSPGE